MTVTSLYWFNLPQTIEIALKVIAPLLIGLFIGYTFIEKNKLIVIGSSLVSGFAAVGMTPITYYTEDVTPVIGLVFRPNELGISYYGLGFAAFALVLCGRLIGSYFIKTRHIASLEEESTIDRLGQENSFKRGMESASPFLEGIIPLLSFLFVVVTVAIVLLDIYSPT